MGSDRFCGASQQVSKINAVGQASAEIIQFPTTCDDADDGRARESAIPHMIRVVGQEPVLGGCRVDVEIVDGPEKGETKGLVYRCPDGDPTFSGQYTELCIALGVAPLTAPEHLPREPQLVATYMSSRDGFRVMAIGLKQQIDDQARNARLLELHRRPANDGPGTAADTSPVEPSAKRYLRSADLSEIRTAWIAPPAFVIAPLMPRGHVTMVSGHGGAGKSGLALGACAHIACSRDWLGFPSARGCRAAFVSLEDPSDVVRHRLQQLANHYDLDPYAIKRNLAIFDAPEGVSALASEARLPGRGALLAPTDLFLELEGLVRGFDLIVLDNASDAFNADENNRQYVRQFVRQMLGKIARENNAAVVLLLHVDKQAARYGSQGNSYSGSTAWHNSARSRLALIPDGEMLELRHEKLNLGRRAEPVPLRFTEGGVLTPVFQGEIYSGDDEALLDCIARAIARGDTVSAARKGPTNAHAIARTLPGFPAALAAARKFWTSLERLEEAGKLVREQYVTAGNRRGERWCVPA